MIQPTLEAYGFEGPPYPVLLASTSVHPDKILLLDTFFRIVIHYGETIANWRKAGYDKDPQHEAFRILLNRPKEDAQVQTSTIITILHKQNIIKQRFPMPRFIETDQHQSQARFLLAAIDPVVTHTSMNNMSRGEIVFTDDVNMKVFMEHLKKLAVQS